MGNLLKLDKQLAARITNFLHRLEELENSRSVGEAFSGSNLGYLWKYRVGDYRMIADIQDAKLSILIIRLGKCRRDWQASC